MKYLGQPLSNIIDYEKLKVVFQFNNKGEFITEDEKLIKWMAKHKNFIKYEDTANKMVCKKCGLQFESKGLLLAHYREHKKEEFK